MSSLETFHYLTLVCSMPGFALERIIHPVGQGGFISETIFWDSFTIVFDCGSKGRKHKELLSRQIDILKKRTSSIDLLFISHFDEDHVNGVTMLVSEFQIEKVIIPFVPAEFRYIYDVLTGGSYSQMRSIIGRRDVLIIEIEDNQSFSDPTHVWEWDALPLLSLSDWNRLRYEMYSHSITISKLDDPQYVASNLATIKGCFISAFGTARMNQNGLVVISQAVEEPMEWNDLFFYNGRSFGGGIFHRTTAFYTGDANLKGRKKGAVISFVKRHCGMNRLGLVQIPHHGSNRNSSSSFPTDFPADVYFYQDRNSVRINRNIGLISKLLWRNVLLGVHSSSSCTFRQLLSFPWHINTP